MTTTMPPRTLLEVMELISKLRSRRAVYQTALAHLGSCYKDTDAGKAEMRITRDDFAIVSQMHIEETFIEMEHRMELLDAEIEELQNQPVGGGAPPAAEQPSPTTGKEDADIAEAAKATAKKGTHGKPRAQGGGPS